MSEEKPSKTPEPDHHAPEQEQQGPCVDVGQIDPSDAKSKPFPESLPTEFRVIIAEEAFQAVQAHAQSDTAIELCGVLAGNLYADDDGPYLVIEQAIEGAATRRTGSQVTFTHETWEKIHSEMEAQCPDLRIVGWYHTHPGFGIFLSDMDQFIQDNFFNLPHQVAFVYDPVADRRGLFIWKDGHSSRLRRYWLGGELVYDEDGGPPAESPPRREERPRAGGTEEQDFDRRPPRPRATTQPAGEEWPLRWWLAGLAAALVVLFAAYWLGGFNARSAARQSSQQARDFKALIRSGLFRDGLGTDLEQLQSRLNKTHNQLLAVQDAAGKDAEGDGAKALEESIETVLAAHREVGRIRKAYTRIDMFATRMEEVAEMPDRIAVLDHKQPALRMLLAELYALGARQMMVEDDEQARRRLAREFAQRAVQLEPELRTIVDRELPGLLPAAPTPEPPKRKPGGE
ncbi:MAG: Mov34/MPN/PAD-1 family protein [bacterium]